MNITMQKSFFKPNGVSQFWTTN
uniref:Uncharacterized protein n=1 Tax=Schmidtea mediterranea TaxID=79327 RepID=A0A1S6KMH8_SCHMD|nr:hypothetical protein Smed-H4 [Schmidtea mediterranea]